MLVVPTCLNWRISRGIQIWEVVTVEGNVDEKLFKIAEEIQIGGRFRPNSNSLADHWSVGGKLKEISSVFGNFKNFKNQR